MSYENVTNTVNTMSYEETLMMLSKTEINPVTVKWVKNWLIEKHSKGKI